jgi:hypothetical protein
MCRIRTTYVEEKAALDKKKPYQFPEDGQQLRPKHVGALINK